MAPPTTTMPTTTTPTTTIPTLTDSIVRVVRQMHACKLAEHERFRCALMTCLSLLGGLLECLILDVFPDLCPGGSFFAYLTYMATGHIGVQWFISSPYCESTAKNLVIRHLCGSIDLLILKQLQGGVHLLGLGQEGGFTAIKNIVAIFGNTTFPMGISFLDQGGGVEALQGLGLGDMSARLGSNGEQSRGGGGSREREGREGRREEGRDEGMQHRRGTTTGESNEQEQE
ncbi:hypothetical protein BU15DRAFT_65236 [Melanogaster broomeanus]|nr:hypothetical protein BU15DRAFT_65236 [Melanogaster broomeanus]